MAHVHGPICPPMVKYIRRVEELTDSGRFYPQPERDDTFLSERPFSG